MKHKYCSEIFCPISERSVGKDDDSSVLYQKVSSNTDKQKFNFLFVWN